ncbi:Cof-type HAD-IIB family hydrolase [Sporolactobacillus sp. THM19-2]|jgi:Cof subfamily protein (haloacid dehalogenase superfamily)|uniref:Cof-type HAD-IIB family hydrolase n=1 Tax=Sporolactobacillus sp. THM19-2 TaxID=2511171 RepID=UPI00101F6B16|nr:Cof-type HAD-IIB family hydrolase [Sporolactobacillus sp. THM19-2]RYL93602.1 HAD family phosphatase [Sporolactobacillus sp. THM19-2]
MIKLIAMDMDGTLLNSHNEIGWENLKAMRYARSKGVSLTIASGRAPFDVMNLLKEADIEAHVIGGNGSTLHTLDGKLLGADFLDTKEALEIVGDLTAKKYFVSVSTEHGIYHPENGELWLRQELERLHKPDERGEGYQRSAKQTYHRNYSSPKDIEASGEGIYKLLVFSFDDQKLSRAREKYEAKHKYAIVSSGSGNFEIMARNVSKGNALYHLASYLDIPLSEVMAIGDNYNDLSMFAVAGISVAMGNADQEIKDRCNRVTLTCAEDGVAHAIYHELGKK